MSRNNISVAILAGGLSSRMGTDKSMLPLAGKPLIAHVIERTSLLGLPIMLITNTPEKHKQFNLPMHSDLYPGRGSLGGIYTALTSSPSDYTLCVACDMPFLNVALLRYMLNLCAGYDAVVPCDVGNYESLHAVYRRTCLASIQQRITEGNLRIRDLYSRLHTRLISPEEVNNFDPERRSFMNLNTPEDLAQIELRSTLYKQQD